MVNANPLQPPRKNETTSKKEVVSLRTFAVLNEGDGARARNHRIDNPVQAHKNPDKSDAFAEARTICAPNDTDFAIVMKAWPTLPAALRAGVLAMVKASGEGQL